MVWIYLAESEDSPKPWKVTSARLPTVKTTDTRKLFSCPECEAGIFQGHPYGMTCGHCGVISWHGWTSFTAVFPAKIFPLLDAVQVWKESEADYFSKSFDSLARFDHPSFSWKTYQRSLVVDWEPLPPNLPPFGMIVDGEFYPLLTWARTIRENDGGFWRTPDTGAGGTSGLLKEGKTHRKSGAAITMRLVDQVNNPRMWPTPDCSDRRSAKSKQQGLSNLVRKWPTPRANSGNGPAIHGQGGLDLQTAVQKYPTPRATRGGSGTETVQKMGITGQLNPTWVEWLMGYPSEWTVLEDWATQWFRPRRVKPSKD